MFIRVLTERQAQSIWNELKIKNIPIDYFSICLVSALEGFFYVNKTKKQYQELHRKIRDQANDLSALLNQTDSNLGVFSVDEKLSCTLSNSDRSTSPKGKFQCHYLGDMLIGLAKEADKLSESYRDSKLLPYPNKD